MHLTRADEYQMHQVLLKISNPNGHKKKMIARQLDCTEEVLLCVFSLSFLMLTKFYLLKGLWEFSCTLFRILIHHFMVSSPMTRMSVIFHYHLAKCLEYSNQPMNAIRNT